MNPMDIIGSSETDSQVFLTHFKPDTGEIVQTGKYSPQGLENMMALPELAAVRGRADLARDYVDLAGAEPVIRPRPTIQGLNSLPQGSTVEVLCVTTGSVKSYTVDDGSFEYVDLPGTYRLTVRRWPYMDFITEIRL